MLEQFELGKFVQKKFNLNHCQKQANGVLVKDLDQIHSSADQQLVIVDRTHSTQKTSDILLRPWTCGDGKDKELLKLILVLNALEQMADVRDGIKRIKNSVDQYKKLLD